MNVIDLGTRLAKAIVYPFFFWRPAPTKKTAFWGVEAIVGLAFGTHAEDEPIGAPNARIVEEMVRLKKRYARARLIAQWEMCDSPLHPSFDLVVGKRWVTHISTADFFRAVREKYPELQRIIIVAHQDHIRRCALIARKFGFVPLIPPLRSIPFDPVATVHTWTRSRWRPPMSLDPRQWGNFWWERAATVYCALRGEL